VATVTKQDDQSPTAYLQDRPVLTTRQARGLGLVAPLLFALLGLALADRAPIERLENVSIDWRFQARGPRTPRSDIILVFIDEQSRQNLRENGRRFELREHLANAIDNLADAGALVVALDVVLEGLGDPAIDSHLADVLADANVILGVTYSQGQLKRAAPLFLESNPAEGVLNVRQDPDGGLRRLPTVLHLDRRTDPNTLIRIPHFPLRAAWYAVVEQTPDAKLRFERDGAWIGDRLVQPGELIDYVAVRDQGWTTLAFEDVVRNRFDPAAVDGAVVLLGESRLVAESFTMPLSDEIQPGLYYHANVVAQILDRRRFDHRWTTDRRRSSLVGVFGLAAGLVAWNSPRWWQRRRGALLLAIYVVAAVTVFLGGWTGLCFVAFSRHVLLPYVAPLAAMALALVAGMTAQWILLIANARRLSERARRIESLFGRSVSYNVLEALKSNPRMLLQTDVREVSVLFCDLRGFTATASDLPPDRVATMLNEYFSHITAAIFEHDGFIDKFVGDEVMAVFSVPLAQPDHAERAVRTAIGIKRRLVQLNRTRRERQEPPLECGIAVHCGPAAAGHIGSTQRHNYTVVGHTVNLAARIQGFTEHGEILVSRAVRDRLPSDIPTAPWKTVEIRGSPGRHELHVVDPGCTG
jgi:adenylate cyclase